MLQFASPARTPGKELAEYLVDRRLGVDATGIDRKAGALGRKPAFGSGKAKVVANQVHQVGGILAVVDRKRRTEANAFRIFAQQPRPDAVEGAGPGQRVGHDAGLVAQHTPRDPFDASGHLGRGAPGEGHE